MSTYTQYGDVVVVNKDFGIELDNLVADLYIVNRDPLGNYFLSRSPLASVPEVLYGETEDRADHIIKTFHRRAERGVNTGVLLSGTKGSGKTMLAKVISRKLAALGIPTIMVTQGYTEANFLELMTKIGDKAVIMFDEFDKTYDKRESQEALLSLLDGTGSGNKLFLLTKNSGFISEFFLNRPSRVFYNFNYDKISLDTMMDYLDRNLQNKEAHMTGFQRLHDVSIELSFDVIQGIVEELNAYPDMEFKECIDMMGISLSSGRGEWQIASITVNGKAIKVGHVSGIYGFNPMKFMANQMQITAYLKPNAEDIEMLRGSSYVEVDDEDDCEIRFSASTATCDLAEGGKIVIESKTPGDTMRIVIEQPVMANAMTKLF